MWLRHLKSIILLTLTESILEVVQAKPPGKPGERTNGEPDKDLTEELETLKKGTFRSLKGQKERSDEGEEIPPIPEPKDCGEWCKIPIVSQGKICMDTGHRPALFFGELGQTPQWSFSQNVSGHQILLQIGNV